MQERTCAREGCDCKFVPVKHSQKYCQCPEHRCYLKNCAEARRIVPQERKCDVCDASFTPKKGSQKRCSPECQREGRRRSNARDRESPDLFRQEREFKLLPIKRLPDGCTVLIVGDIHMPFHDGPTLAALERFWDAFKPDLEIYNGDIFDLYSASVFDKNPSRMFSLQDEIDVCVGWLRKRVKKNPNARRIFLEGNHEDRLRRWLWRHGPELQSLRALDVEEQFALNELEFTHLNYRSRLDVLGALIEHGYRASRSDTAYPMNVARLMGLSTQSSGVCGHSHGLNTFRWRDARGSHSYREGGCLCRMNLEYAPFPTTWAWGFVHGVVRRNKLYLTTVPIYDDGFEAYGKFYPRT